MRTHIAKSLQTRCKAIQNAVKTYNAAAQALNPPRPTLDWSRVSHYSFLDEFNLLRDSRQDIHQKPWTQPAIRETMTQANKIKRAHEEITRCNIEVRRLHTSIIDENNLLESTLARLQAENNAVFGPVNEYTIRRRRVNAHLLLRLQQIFALDGYSGERSCGIRKGTSSESSPSSGINGEEYTLPMDDDDDVGSGDGSDEEVRGDITALVDYVSELSLRS
jgi:hypothetical protein